MGEIKQNIITDAHRLCVTGTGAPTHTVKYTLSLHGSNDYNMRARRLRDCNQWRFALLFPSVIFSRRK
jgi:hypothetical protein